MIALFAALLSRSGSTVEALADELRLTPRTVRRRLLELSEARLAEETVVDEQSRWRATRSFSSNGALVPIPLLRKVTWLIERLPRGGERDVALETLRRYEVASIKSSGVTPPRWSEESVRALDELASAARDRRSLRLSVLGADREHLVVIASVWDIDLDDPAHVSFWDHRASTNRRVALSRVRVLAPTVNVRFVDPPAVHASDAVEFEVVGPSAEDRVRSFAVDVRTERSAVGLRCRVSREYVQDVAQFVLSNAVCSRCVDPEVVREIHALVERVVER